jgi:hypothetical protein
VFKELFQTTTKINKKKTIASKNNKINKKTTITLKQQKNQ